MTSRGTDALDQRMDARRVQLGLTWAELAARAGISREALRNIRGGGRIRSATRRKLETALGWTEGGMDVARAGGHPELAGSPVPGLSRDTLAKALAAKRRMLVRELGPDLGAEAWQRWVESIAQASAELDRDATEEGAG